jgi:hypothetical protein
MPTTVEDFLNEALVMCERPEVNVSVSRPDMKVILYEAFQDVYNQAIVDDPSLFAKSVDFVSTASLAHPADYRDVILIEIPSSKAGAARRSPDRAFDNLQDNDNLKGAAADPLYREDSSTFLISPASAGTLYYRPKYGKTVLSVETQDLEELLPRPYIQRLLNITIQLAQIRHLRDVNVNPTNLQRRANRMEKSMKILKAAERPLNLTDTDTPAPAHLQANATRGAYGSE